MDILLKREQGASPLAKRTLFKLWVKLDFTEEERELARKYGFNSAVLIDAVQPGLLRASAFVGFFAFLAIYLGMITYVIPQAGWRINWLTVLFGSLLAACAIGYYYFHEKRETIYVIDLMRGRFFDCRSVIELARKEAFLENISAHLRQVLEGAKHWGGKTQIEVLPLPPEEAKKALLRGPVW